MKNKKPQFIIVLIVLFFLFVLPRTSQAANHYIRSDAAGANNGNDWTNAWTSLPANLLRGDVYYIADGTYTGYTFDDATSGSQLITIKKAISSDHGMEIGWQDSYGDGQAVFTGTGTLWSVTTNYWVINGQIGDGSGGYGFKLDFTGTGDSARALNIDGSDILIQYTDIEGNGHSGIDVDYNQDGVYVVGGAYSNITLAHNYIHDWKRCGIILASGVHNIIVEHNFIARTYSTATAHGQAIQIGASGDSNHGITIRYNKFYNIQGSGFIYYLGGTNSIHYDIDVYGNVFWGDDPLNWNTGTVAGTNTDTTCNNCNFYNNTVFGLTGRGSSGMLELDHGYGAARNNVFYQSNTAFAGTWTLSHNASEDGYPGQLNFLLLVSDPFVNSAGGDFRLLTSLDAGYDLSSIFTQDIVGNTYNMDGIWDRGAYSYIVGGADEVAPLSPEGLAVR